jgi:hypothetical protein
VLAPTRPRLDDVRRYCLECSKGSGRLVRRVAEALEKKRAARKTRKAARQKKPRPTRTPTRTACVAAVVGCLFEGVSETVDQLSPFRGAYGPYLLRRVSKPKKPNVLGPTLILYDHGGDRFDAEAIVTCGRLRWLCSERWHSGVTPWRTYIRRQIERALHVRPKIENPDKLEHEVAELRRAQAAVTILQRVVQNQDIPFYPF